MGFGILICFCQQPGPMIFALHLCKQKEMKTTIRTRVNGYGSMLIWAILAITIAAGNVLAHNVLSSITTENSLPVGTFHYADGNALSYAEVKVWAPDDDQVEFQNGRTDKNGRFSFAPDQEGIWRIEIDDGLGHAAKAEYEAKEVAKTLISPQGTENHTLLYAILGVSLIFNLAFIIQNRRK